MQKLQLTIPEPCHESWQQMTPTDQGRFCNACAKEVVDFSMMTDTEVLNYFTTLTHDKVCGRALPGQLDRTITRPKEPTKRLFWYWNYIVMFFLFFTKGSTAKAQGGIKPVTECSPVKANDIRGEVVTMGKLRSDDRQIVRGSVVDEKGRPVPYLAINIKGENTGVAADSNGIFKISARPNDILVANCVGFKPKEVLVSNQKDIKIVLGEYDRYVLGGAMIVSYVTSDGVFNQPFKQSLTALLEVKDNETNAGIANSTITITKENYTIPDIVFTDSKGAYKLKGIKKYDRYQVKVEANGYKANEFTIKGTEFQDAKKVWEVLLKKEIVVENKKSGEVVVMVQCTKRSPAIVRDIKKMDAAELNSLKPVDMSQALTGKVPGVQIKLNNDTANRDTRIRVGGVRSISGNNQPLLVVDDVQLPMGYLSKLNSNDVDSVKVLKGAAASALYGSEAANGVIIVTTKKLKVKNLDTVSVTATGTIRRSVMMGAMVSGVTVKRNFMTDTLKMVATKITGAVKVYPNPVQRGNASIVSLKLKQTGLYRMQVTDVNGRVVLQKQLNATTKEWLDKIDTDTNWSGGTYYLSIYDNRSQLINKAGFIVL